MLPFIRLLLCTRAALIAENLFLRKQLAIFKERKVKPSRITRTARLAMIALARFFDWRDALVIVKPETFIKWHRTAFRNHAKAIVACDFFISVTANFRVLYVFVAMEIGSRSILHCNVTEHPTAEWATQQFREFLAFDRPYRFLIHDRDSIFSAGVNAALKDLACAS